MRHGSVVAKPEQRYGVVVGRFNDLVTKLLLEGAKGAFAAHGVAMSNVEVCIRVSECRSQQAEGALVLLLLSAQADTQAGWGLRQLANSRSAQLSCSRKALLCAPPPRAGRCAGSLAALSCRWWPRPWPSLANLMQSSASAWW